MPTKPETLPETLPGFPEINTPLPGPKTKALIERDAKFVSPSYTRGYPLSIDYGRGAMVVDVDGNRFLDFCAGIAVCATGHSHPQVVRAIQDQAEKFLHMSGTDFYYQSLVDVAERLANSMPWSKDNKVFLGNSGTEAIEGGMKLARYATNRKKLIAFHRAFHGRTMGALSLTASKTIHKQRFSPLVPDIVHAHYPYAYRDLFQSATEDECAERCLDYIKTHVFKHLVEPQEVAAFVLEPIQGEGGYVAAPAKFLLGLQALAREHGILIMVDEVQSGIGRTGKFWASEWTPGFEPDIICSAKGLASGLPLGAFIASGKIMSWPPGTHATTFGGNPLACVAAMKTFELLDAGLMQQAQEVGAHFKQRLQELQARFDSIGDVRGRGLMLAIELVESKASKNKAPQLRDAVVDDCFYEGLVILGCGENNIRFCPPLVITKEQVDCAIEILRRVLEKHS